MRMKRAQEELNIEKQATSLAQIEDDRELNKIQARANEKNSRLQVLAGQVNQRRMMGEIEKEAYEEQGKLWKQDHQRFISEEKQRKDKSKVQNVNNRNYLVNQMNDKMKVGEDVSTTEYKLNKNFLNKVDL